MIPIYDPDNFYEQFLLANNWIKPFLPNTDTAVVVSARLRVKNSKPGLAWKQAWEKMWQGAYGDLLEKQAKGFQWTKLKLSLKEKSEEPGTEVIVADNILKFHENDRRAEYRKRWLEKAKVQN